MTKEEIIEIIADILEAEIDDIVENAELAGFEAWDSVAILSVISEVESATGKYLHANDIKKLNTIGDLIAVFEA